MLQLKNIPKNMCGERKICSPDCICNCCIGYVRLKISFPMQEVHGTDNISHFRMNVFAKWHWVSSGVWSAGHKSTTMRENVKNGSAVLFFVFRRIGFFFFAFDLNQNDVENSIFFCLCLGIYACLEKDSVSMAESRKKHTTYKNSTKGNTFRVESWFEI